MNRKELFAWFKENPNVAQEVFNETHWPYQNCPTSLLMLYYSIEQFRIEQETMENSKLTLWQKIKNIFAW